MTTSTPTHRYAAVFVPLTGKHANKTREVFCVLASSPLGREEAIGRVTRQYLAKLTDRVRLLKVVEVRMQDQQRTEWAAE